MQSTPEAIEVRPAPDTRPRSKWRRRLMVAGQLTLGLILGLALTELAFAKRDQHAFPHVNFYVPDAELGVRLEPGARMHFRLGDNPLTTINVNDQGYRGASWPTPSDDELLVFGDSQVFGLGVEDDETFSAVLAEHSGRTVLNAGVPTYGPPEYLALAAELLERREGVRGQTVVYVLNFLNDPFEIGRPNRERHAIWDGWAVRIETAPPPEAITEFPGRRWLMSRSHTIYAARRWWHARDAAWFATVDRGLPSEGQWDDLLVTSERTQSQLRGVELEAMLLLTDAETRSEKIEVALADLSEELERAGREIQRQQPGKGIGDAEIIEARPGGIVRNRYSESARDITVTAEAYQAALARRAERERASARHTYLRKQREVLLAELGQVADVEIPAPPELPRSVFEDHFAQLRDLCQAHGAELLIVMLPFDVQVSSDEWAKYGVEQGPDMSPTLALLDDAGASAAQLGIPAFNATEALRAAEPGAFLDGDIHMTAKGHAALGRALADRLASLPSLDGPDESKSK